MVRRNVSFVVYSRVRGIRNCNCTTSLRANEIFEGQNSGHVTKLFMLMSFQICSSVHVGICVLTNGLLDFRALTKPGMNHVPPSYWWATGECVIFDWALPHRCAKGKHNECAGRTVSRVRNMGLQGSDKGTREWVYESVPESAFQNRAELASYNWKYRLLPLLRL